MVKWTPPAAARLGYLAGKGTPFKSILQDDQLGSRSAQSIRNASTRWGLPMNGRAATVPVANADHEAIGRARKKLESSWAVPKTKKHVGSDGRTCSAEENAGTLAVPIPPRDLPILEDAAAARGLSTASFAATLLHTITRERLFNAVMDDDR
jgi:hypothetical protein